MKTSDASQPSVDAVRERIQRIETLFQEQVAKGQFDNARLIVEQIGRLLPGEALVYSMRARLLLAEENCDEAKRWLAEGLTRHPHHFELLFLLGEAFERQQDRLNAYHMYAQAEFVAVGREQKDQIRDVMARLKQWQANATLSFDSEVFDIAIPSGDDVVRVGYSVPALRSRKGLYDVVVRELHPDVEKMLEFECGEGLVARNLAALGLDVVGLDSDPRYITMAILLDMHARLRAPEQQRRLRLIRGEATPEQMDALRGEYDAVVYTPRWTALRDVSEQWLHSLLTNLMRVPKHQVFVALTESVENDGGVERERSAESANSQDGAEGQPAGGPGVGSTAPEPMEAPHGADGKGEERELRRAFEGALRSVLEKHEKEGLLWRKDGDTYIIDTRALSATEGDVRGSRGFVVPQGLEVFAGRSELVDVELAKCRDLQAFGYAEGHWHPFVAQIRQYIENPEVPYEQSVLRQFYDAFQPGNRHEQMFGRRSKAVPPMHRGWAPLPWIDGKVEKIVLEPPETRPGGTHFHGPNTKEFGEGELHRVLASYRMLKEQGYAPEIYPDGYVQGFFLKDGDDYRFVITEGQHRIAALAVLGQEVVRCRLAPDSHYIHCVDIERVLVWPQVKRRLYKPELARRIFHLFFQSDPVQRLREWGLDIEPFD